MDYSKDFKKYAMDKGVSSLNMHYFEKNLEASVPEASLTPYILEEREMRVTQMDIFSRLMRDRILWVSGVVNQQMCDVLQAQIMYLDSIAKQDIKMHINSPGGSVLHGLGIVDLMRYINSDIETINVGLAASMGSILLSSGTKGKRSSLNFSKVMIHQVSSGAQGHVEDNRISQMESEKYNYILFKMLAQNSGRSFDYVLDAARRDKWLSAYEALEFGFIDEVITNEKTYDVKSLMDGFEDYYTKEVLKK
jgi:ATP-dependent Clp protease protease subunit